MIKEKLLKKLHQILIDIAKANDTELERIGVELAEIEKLLIQYTPKLANKKN